MISTSTRRPIKNETLQQHIQKYFVRVRKCIVPTSFNLDVCADKEVDIFRDPVNVFQSIKHTAEGLRGRGDAKLRAAERMHSCVLEKLSNAESRFSACFLSYRKHGTKERRGKALTRFLEYSHDPTSLLEAQTDTFGECTNKASVRSCCDFASKVGSREIA